MKNQKGITLVALIITIIVMIILAGIALIFTVGEEGVLSQAQNSVDNTKKENVKEQVLLAWSASKNEYLASDKTKEKSTYFTKEKLNANLSEGEVIDVTYDSNGDSEVIYKLDGEYYKVQISLEGVGTVVGEPTETPPTLIPTQKTLLSQINATNYGDYVNYEVDLGIVAKGLALSEDNEVPKTDWRIFYADENNVFLIASDYLPASKFPTGVFEGNDGKYYGYWAQDSVDTSKLTTSGSVTSNTNFLFTKLSNVTATNFNYQAVATLLDSSKWSKFAKSGYVDDVNTAVIGSPTVEMWMKSWNERYDDELAFDATALGYKVGLTESSLSYNIINTAMQEKQGWNNTLYYPHAGSSVWNGCYGYWLASPSACTIGHVMYVKSGGEVYAHSKPFYYYAVRPVVCLKTGITATQDENDVWQLGE